MTESYVQATLPDNPPVLTPGAARALLRILIKAQNQRENVEFLDEGAAA